MRRESEPTLRVHVKMFQDDWDWITEHYGQTIGSSKFIRLVLRAYIKQFRANEELVNDNQPAPGIDSIIRTVTEQSR